MRVDPKILLNFVAFQIGWFACVLGGANDLALAGTLAVAVVVGMHLVLAVEDVQDVLGNSVRLIGVVPDDESIITSTNRGEPASMNEASQAGLAYRNIARRLLGEEVPFINLMEEKTGFLARFKKIFGG